MNPGNSIFSIDVDAHLKKAASYTFGSSAHYPVELVRAALRRGAQHVDIQVGRGKIYVRDDGAGIDESSIENLTCLMDPNRGAEVKEESIELLQNREGMGTLAIFASNPDEILLENVSSHGKTRIHFRNGRYQKTNIPSITAGTAITLTGGHRDYEQEKQLVEAFCRSVPREIRLNRRSIGYQPLLTHQVAAMKLSPSTYFSGGQIGIPVNGAICHLRFLDRAIPWRHITLPPQKGYIFDAAVECSGEAPQESIDTLLQYADRLYMWACNQYAEASPSLQARIEELIFTHTRITGDETYMNHFAPFKIYNTNQALNLNQVRQKASEGALFAAPRKKERTRYNIGSKTVLLLPREQADLLINYLNIPIVFLDPAAYRQNPLPIIWSKIKKGFERLIIALTPAPREILDSSRLTKPELMLIMGLSRHFPGYRIHMIPSKGPFALALTKKGYLYIRRNHPLVRKAVVAIQKDPANIAIFVDLAIYNHSSGTKPR
jgi:hypothetical protein